MGGGLSLQDLTEITGHKSTATAKRFYDNQAVPRMLVLPLDLKQATTPVPIAKVKHQLRGVPDRRDACTCCRAWVLLHWRRVRFPAAYTSFR